MTADLAPALAWQVCSAVGAVSFLAIGIHSLRTFRSIGVVRMNATPGSNSISLTTSIIGLATCVLQIANLAVLQTFWPFFALIVVGMLMALLQFARLILTRPQ